MAFVQVVRRSMRPEEYTELRFGWLGDYIYDEKYEITDIKICDARQTDENEYEFYPGGYRPLHRGDLYYTPDGTVFFKAHAVVPESMRGKEVWLSMWTAAEVIVKANNVYVGGIDPNRDRVLLSPYINKEELIIEMEGYNRSKPDDERNPDAMALKGCRQEFQGLYLATVNHAVLDLFYDLQLLLDIMKSEYFNEDYRVFLKRELNLALNLIDFDALRGGDRSRLTEQARAAAGYIQKHIYENTDFNGSGSVALVGHSHLDIAYYWRRIHTVHKNARTVLIQLRLMDRYPEFKYTHTQAYTYELLEKYYPELFEELKEKIAAGSFEPTGAMYIEPDCNVPNAESLVRQCLYGQMYFRSRFGMTVHNCWLPDVFGNSWILPQILKKSGVDYFVSNKMSTWNDTNRFPHNNFIWKGIDESEVYACVPPTHFITWNMPSQIQENWEAYQEKETGGQTLSMFGYGDGGSGATEEMLELMRRFDKLSVMPKTEHMGAQEFLEKNLKDNENLEVWDGELYLEMHRGTFTTKAMLKKENRRLEFALREAEIAAVLREAGEEPYPGEEITGIYKKFLVNQFHDILPGSHIHPVYQDAMNDYQAVEEETDRLIGKGRFYFNSLNFPRKSITFVENEAGNQTRCGQRGSFVIPGMEAFSMKEGFRLPQEQSPQWITVNGLEAETPFYRIRFGEDGSILSLYDKEYDREWVKSALNRLHLYQDLPGVYDAWDILPNYKEKETPVCVRAPLHFAGADSVCAVFETELGVSESVWKMKIRLFAEDRSVDVENCVDWNEKHKLAKVEFDINVVSRELVCDTSAGYTARETHRNTSWQQAKFEVCSHKWCDLSETGGGVAVINDGKYGIGLDGSRITLSLLRANIRPDITSDIGRHEFCYAIYPHAGNAVEAQINRRAYEYNVPLRKTRIPEKTDGKLGLLLQAITQAGSGIFLQALKKSEDGNGIIVRLSEQDGTRGKIALPFAVQPVNLLEDAEGEPVDTVYYKPFEIISFFAAVDAWDKGDEN